MKIAITGGAGFIGGHVVRLALQHDHRVTIIDRAERPSWVPDRVAYERLDLADTLFTFDGFDAVVHAAAHADISRNWESDEERAQLYRDNVTATINVLERVRGAVASKFVFISSAAVMWQGYSSPYSITKDFGEKLTNAYLHPTMYSIVRLVSCVGERYSHGHIADFVKAAKERGHITGKDTGLSPKSFVHVADAADAILRCAEMPTSRPVAVAAGTWSWRDTAAMMGVPIVHWKEQVAGWPGDPVGLQVQSDWQCRRTVGEGVREALVSLGWFR